VANTDGSPVAITTEKLFSLFGLPEEDGPGRLVYAARKEHYTLPFLVLSVLADEGVELGQAAAGELARAQRRAGYYNELMSTVLCGMRLHALKGRSLAGRYPPGVFRAQGDLDLLAADEQELWRAAVLLCRERPLSAAVSVFGGQPRDYLLSLCWSPEEPLVDPERKVEISTVPLTGDFAAVPVRRTLPGDPVLANLICLAEERLQRPFHLRDALDLYVLSPALSELADDVAMAAAEYRLAPEVAELIEYAAARLPVAPLEQVLRSLGPLAAGERARRASPGAPAEASGGSAGLLRRGGLLHGMPLGDTTVNPDIETAHIHVFSDEALLLTPIGDYLLVAGALVSQTTYDRAHGERDRLRAAGYPIGVPS
jgi:hypothetical protein